MFICLCIKCLSKCLSSSHNTFFSLFVHIHGVLSFNSCCCNISSHKLTLSSLHILEICIFVKMNINQLICLFYDTLQRSILGMANNNGK